MSRATSLLWLVSARCGIPHPRAAVRVCRLRRAQLVSIRLNEGTDHPAEHANEARSDVAAVSLAGMVRPVAVA
jgi:hypothetical protein